ncbi:MAG: TIGR04283 family arsenosugar biosynthesis glycosyltransferase [Candidatus Dadabacteria bacterium]|nr:TIGR04283 family arsenosugar biosynthesis glycosyltransferase [Candidatus Dadabacteria bacterium]
MISIVIPTYNESGTIKTTLDKLYEIVSPDDEVIVVDGFSEDNTKEIVSSFPNVKLHISKRGRAKQMNLGAEMAKNEYILFLHADTLISANCLTLMKSQIISNGIRWGWFPIKLNSPKFIFRILETGSNIRTRFTGSPLGDQGIFIRIDLFNKVGGYPEIPIMEDIEFITKIKAISKGVEIKSPVKTSVRRFEKSGIIKTFVTMWVLRILYYLGTSPKTLASYYDHIR